MRRAAIGGSLVLIAVAVAVVLFGGQDDDEENFVPGPPQTFVLDADAGGAVLRKSGRIVGVAANGDVKWSLPIRKGVQDYPAVCLRRCPQAEVVFARSLTDPPDRPDGPRLRLGPPSWRPVTVGPRLRVDRPLLGGPAPLRVTVDRAGAKPRLRVAGGQSIRASSTNLGAAQATDRRTGLLGDEQRTMVLRRRAGGWSVVAQRRLSPPGDNTCISPDGSRIGLVGQGPPRVARVGGGRIGIPRTVTGVRREESNAEACALAGDTMATAVIKTGGHDDGGGLIRTIRVHAGRSTHTVRLRPSRGPFYDLWVSPRTGTTAVRIGDEVRLIDPEGQAKTLPAEVATVLTPGRLLLIPRRGRARTRRF